MDNPFLNKTFVMMMEKISQANDDNMITIVNKMGEMDKEKDVILYYTYDSVLSYLSWKNIKDDPALSRTIAILEERVKQNLQVIKLDNI